LAFANANEWAGEGKIIMDYIEFEDCKALKIEVEYKAFKDEEEISKLVLVEGLCLMNSYKVAKIKKCKMVEGFLVTKFKNKPLDCAGHVWNKVNDQYLDYTLLLKSHNEEVLSHNYYLVEEYDYIDKSVAMLKENGKEPTNFEIGIVPLQEHLVFKTKVKAKEIEVLKSLREIESKAK
jgi:hypothetical protein